MRSTEILDVLPCEVAPHDVLDEGRVVVRVRQVVSALSWDVELDVGMVRRVVDEPGKWFDYSDVETLRFDMMDDPPTLRVVRGMPQDAYPIRT